MKNYKVSRGDRDVHVNIDGGKLKIDVTTEFEFADGTRGALVSIQPAQGEKITTEINRGGIHEDAMLIRIKRQ